MRAVLLVLLEAYSGGMSASDPTAAELLTAVNAAIYELVTGKVKQKQIGERSYTYYDLPALRQLREDLRVEAQTTTGTVRVADVSRSYG